MPARFTQTDPNPAPLACDLSRSLSAGLLLLGRWDSSGRSLRIAASFESCAAVVRAPLSFDFLARLLLDEEAVALADAVVSPAPITAVFPPLALAAPLVLVLTSTLTPTSPFSWDVSEQGWLFPPPASPPSPTLPLPTELLERFRLLDGYRRSELSLQAGHNHYTKSCGVLCCG